MSATVDDRVGQMAGPEALPRKNGELVFEAPWEGRAFGLAVALSDQRHYDCRSPICLEPVQPLEPDPAQAVYVQPP